MDLRRVDHLPQYVFSRLDELKAQVAAGGADVIDLGIGSPDVPTPGGAIERLVTEARDPRTHGYPTSAGAIAAREALAAWYERRYDVRLDPCTQTLVTWGASDALAHLPWVLLGRGDTALVPEPCYPIHRYAVRFSGADALPVPMWAADGGEDYDLAAEVEVAWRGAHVKPRVILFSFPHNPTTRCVRPVDFDRLVAFARTHDVVLVHDFAYADIAFDGYRPPSLLAARGATEVAVELVSLSKSHNMAGWRIGFAAGNAAAIAGLARLKSYLDYGVALAVQGMAVAALEECDDVPGQMAALYQRRRDLLCDGLAARGWPVRRPRGTMFVWAQIPAAFRAMGSLAFAESLLREAHVVVSPGVGFTAGPEAGRDTWADGHVRFALVQPEERIEKALAAVARVMDSAAPATDLGATPDHLPSSDFRPSGTRPREEP